MRNSQKGALTDLWKKDVRGDRLVRLPWYPHPITSFTNVGNDLRTYLSPIVTNRSGEQSFSKSEMVKWKKEHH